MNDFVNELIELPEKTHRRYSAAAWMIGLTTEELLSAIVMYKLTHEEKEMKLTKKQRFIQFLKDEGIFEAYKNNWDPDWCTKPILDPEDYINYAFEWSETIEDYFFWSDIHDNWEDILDKEYKE